LLASATHDAARGAILIGMIYIAVKIIDATRHSPEKLQRSPVQLREFTRFNHDLVRSAITIQSRTKKISLFIINLPTRVNDLRIKLLENCVVDE